MWRGGVRSTMSVAAPFVWRCLSGSAITPFPYPAHRTQQADFPHCALGQDLTPSPRPAPLSISSQANIAFNRRRLAKERSLGSRHANTRSPRTAPRECSKTLVPELKQSGSLRALMWQRRGAAAVKRQSLESSISPRGTDSSNPTPSSGESGTNREATLPPLGAGADSCTLNKPISPSGAVARAGTRS